MKVLFIAYYFDPYPGVGAKRMSYWANNFYNSFGREHSLTVITATPQNSDNVSPYQRYYVPDNKATFLKYFFKTDKGASWLPALLQFLKGGINLKDYDVAVLTGNPFLHFFVIKYLKKQGVKTILDFRDPFAVNPRGIKSNTLIRASQKKILEKIEYYFVKSADGIITVNQFCCELISGYSKFKNKFFVIDNGYDEEVLKDIPRKEILNNKNISFGYAGSLYYDRNPSVFLDCLQQKQSFQFVHIGSQSNFLMDKNLKNLIEHGQKNYRETLTILNNCQVCMLFTSGFEFESSTKIFDYIALNKFIWIITEGEIKTGALHQITERYPNIIWSKNNPEEITAILNALEREFKIFPFPDKYTFSRAQGLKLLSETILKAVNG